LCSSLIIIAVLTCIDFP